MRFLPFLLIWISSALQAFLAWAWTEAGLARRFTDVFVAFHGEAPLWSNFAFALGWGWLAPALAACGWTIWAWRRKPARPHPWRVCGASVLLSLAMLYAMYPLHAMHSVGTI